MKACCTLALLLAILSGCSRTPETLVESGYDEQEMEAAINRARSETDGFIAELANPTGTNHAVKAPIEDSGAVEHFWLIDISYDDGQFAGTINNEAGIVSNVRLGDKWTIRKEDISDWMFLRDGKMHGNYTMRPLLATMPEEQATKLRSMLAVP